MEHLTATLRREIEPHVARLTSLPYLRALRDGTLPLDGYLGYLRASYIVQAALELALSQCTHPAVRAVCGDEPRRSTAIENDLAHFGAQVTMVEHATLRAELLAQAIRLAARRSPPQLIGYLYTQERLLEGALPGRATLAKRFGEGGGFAFLSSHEGEARGFGDLEARLAEVKVDEATQASIVTAAAHAFEDIENILLALYLPDASELRDLVCSLNPEAGYHRVPDDLREIEAALRAGEASWQRFPYYAARYGPRGLRFTRSDSAWLATLSRQVPPQVDKEVVWLGQVLAARGMPRWLLEQHLDVLHDALVEVLPSRAREYAVFREAAKVLADERRAAMSDASFRSLSAAFAAQAGSLPDRAIPEAGALVVAAVIDERCGVKRSVESLVSWLGDRKRFSGAWVGAVRATVADAREAR